MHPLSLGPFDLHVRFAAGARGEVWFGRHREQDVPVAVKVLHATWARDSRYVLAFRNEVRQIARLSHRHVITVLDQGEIPTSAVPSGPLLAGSPYLVMEHASLGSLREQLERMDWPTARDVVATLLETLAYVHARGVLHRDIKPENILFTHADALASGLRLSDFGLAPPSDRGAEDEGSSGGTPWYMAPEQIRGDRAAQGPWTDLYAVGALAWELVSGVPPFAYRTARESLQAALNAPLPPLRARFAVPVGLEPWLHTLLAKDPRKRPVLAADALAGLLPLGAGLSRATSASSMPRAFANTSGMSTQSVLFFDEEPEPALGEPTVPEPPAVWRDDAVVEMPRLVGAGLSLAPLRVPPLTGRRPERAQMWEALLDVHRRGAPRVLLLRGPQGIGKTRLAIGVAEMASTVGAAWPVVLQLRGSQVSSEPLWDQIRSRLVPPDVSATDPGPVATREGLVQTLDAMRAAARRRPVLLVLDDLLHSPDARLLVGAIARGDVALGVTLPLLVVATVDDESSSDMTGRATQLEDLVGSASLCTVQVGPLPRAEMSALMSEGMGLDPGLAALVTSRAEGSPLFATQLVRGWLRVGALVAGAEGICIRPGFRLDLPDDLHALWHRRIVEVLGSSVAESYWLLVAAALGSEVIETVWTRACHSGGWVASSIGFDALVSAGLARTTPRGWAFGHAMLRESIIRAARDAGRWAGVCRVAAAALDGEPVDGALLGRLLMDAGAADDAFGPLLEGLTLQLDRSDWALAREQLEDLERWYPSLAPSDPRRAALSLARIRLHLGRGEMREADLLAARAAEEARRCGSTGHRVSALRYRGMTAMRLGDSQRAEAMLLQAQQLASAGALHEELARSNLHLGTLYRLRADADAAIEAFSAAEQGFTQLGDKLGVADTLSELANAHLTLRDDLDSAERCLHLALSHYHALSRTSGLAFCHTTLGDILRRRGDAAGAESEFERALEMFERIGSANAAYLHINLGLLALEARRLEAAAGCFARARVRARGSGEVLAHAAVGAMAIAALQGDAVALAAALSETEAVLGATGVVAPDVLRCATMAAVAAEASGDLRGAAVAREIAQAQEMALRGTYGS